MWCVQVFHSDRLAGASLVLTQGATEAADTQADCR